ncbi:MAG: 16S rRNA (cytidine(1402)-2'-O)-methyltransferase [Bowdeniella nasicola]|nr:16S rRNA (cytidine(1402)-2'-O)-methyltransferase [Bowdeniella nasicola]
MSNQHRSADAPSPETTPQGPPVPPLPPGITLAATPIGNLSDATFRLRSALGEADVIAAEDTRRVRALAAGLNVALRAHLISLHEHNETARLQELVDRAEAGERILVVSDAGMPTISDPGFHLVAAAASRGVGITVAPGASAPVTALALAGLPTDAFTFNGFLPRKGRDRRERLEQIAEASATQILFESPHRVAATLADLAEHCGPDRRAALARELTKLHEEVRRGTLADLAAWAEGGVRGEVVLIIGGSPHPKAADSSDSRVRSLAAEVRALADLGLRLKDAARHVAAREGVAVNALYRAATRQ